ncbi:response regulator [Moritella marina ATCC 15381]|uniref:Transcriptional regulatory protein n=1 Tax=Moritella marina ATCC 15381 TaxID=1202962 RepID=A0A5J6WP48_MORMI|nr:response regulator [Moritella marina]QFI38202.1 response regulator [Moritella marina ATCC 15381]
MTSTNTIKVLIIEDDVGIAEIHRRNLMKIDGLDIIGIATTKAEAEVLLDVLTPDLILLDVYLPDGNGLDILRDLRQQQHACDVILITADRDSDTLQAAMRGGVVDYILKPVIFARLEESLNKYLKQKNQFVNLDDVDQHMVDAMISVSVKSPATSRLPKGIDSVTLDKVRGLFAEHADITADNAGVLIGASRTTARRYLEHLISTGELVADLNYGTVGRPERTYKKQVR